MQPRANEKVFAIKCAFRGVKEVNNKWGKYLGCDNYKNIFTLQLRTTIICKKKVLYLVRQNRKSVKRKNVSHESIGLVNVEGLGSYKYKIWCFSFFVNPGFTNPA